MGVPSAPRTFRVYPPSLAGGEVGSGRGMGEPSAGFHAEYPVLRSFRIQTYCAAAAILLTIIAAARVASTYHVFSETVDEQFHVTAGMEWLDKGTYTYETLHPPLARVAVASGPYLAGIRGDSLPSGEYVGEKIFSARGQYSHNLALARAGTLPFLLAAILLVWAWTRQLFGHRAALAAVLLFTNLPPVLAHAGLATTDMAVTATVFGALLVFINWLERPSWFWSCLLGAAVALAVLCKFSALVFLPACGLAILTLRGLWPKRSEIGPGPAAYRRSVGLLISLALGFLIIWGAYRFSVGQVSSAEHRPHPIIDRVLGATGILHDSAYFVVESKVPAPELFRGSLEVGWKNARGFDSYLMGRIYPYGRWYFFPVALLVKTPIAFLILAVIGGAALIRGAWRRNDYRWVAPLVAAIAVLLVVLPSNLNYGVRHILPIYPLLAIVAGVGVATLWDLGPFPRLGRVAAVVLLLWQLISSTRAHPDYLAYFNHFAGSHPEEILVDSDLDWGQDLLRLSETVRARKIDELTLGYFGTAEPSQHQLPPLKRLDPCQPATGWVAASETLIRMRLTSGKPQCVPYAWLEAFRPVGRVGHSIRLYYIPGTQ